MQAGVRALAGLACGLVLVLVTPVAAARPGFALRLSVRGITADEVPVLTGFLHAVETRLPLRVQASLAQTVWVAFDLRPEAPLPPLYQEPQVVVPGCPGLGELAKTHVGRAQGPQELARLEATGLAGLGPHIRLHRGFREIIRLGPHGAQTYACGHRSLYQLAVATLLHEVMHLYDAQEGLSRDPRYRHLQRFEPQGLFRRMAARNQLTSRSVDAYEWTSLAESAAVHAEYFLLDPEYRCRRPASYAFFEQALHFRPFPHAACSPNWTVYHRGEPRLLDPERIYQVHYLMAARGQGLASRFGHSMFRLVICSPDRAAPGPDCLDDVQEHIVLGFGANLQTDLQISAWKGLTGGYVSQLFVKPLADVLIEYTERELRSLESFPLRLSREELRQFVRRALEIYWSYEGRYYFLTNNCASEALSLLQSTSVNPALQRISRITPTGVRDDLLRAGLIDLPPLPVGPGGLLAKERLGLYFPSLLSRHTALYEALRAHLPRAAPRTLRGYLADTRAAQRRQWLQTLMALPAPQALSASAQAFALEGLIVGNRFAEVERVAARFILDNARTPHPLMANLRALLPRLGLELPWLLARPGYGIPLIGDVRRPPDAERDATYRQLWNEAQRILRHRFPVELAEWQSAQDNRRWLAEYVVTASAAVQMQPDAAQQSLAARTVALEPAEDATHVAQRGESR